MARRNEVSGLVSDMVNAEIRFYDPDGRGGGWPDDRPLTYEGDAKIAVVIPPYMSAGDYSNGDGGLVRANVNVFTENFDDLEGTYWWALRGDYGSFGIAVLNNAFEESRGTDEEDLVTTMLETIAGLENYPYLEGAEDEENEIRMNEEGTQWADYGAADFRHALAVDLGLEGDAFDDVDDALLHAVYVGLGDLFSVYVDWEGSGDNIAAVWHFDSWSRSFKGALVPWDDAEGNNILAGLVESAVRDPGERFGYRGDIYNVFRFTREHARTADAAQVFRDWVLDHGPEGALAIAMQKDAKFAGLGALRKRGENGSVRYLFRGPAGELYGITPDLWDRPDMSIDEARETLERTYGMRPGELVYETKTFNEFTQTGMERVLDATFNESPEDSVIYPTGKALGGLDVNDNGETRYKRHPFSRIAETNDERVFTSLLLPGFDLFERKVDGHLRFRVRGQFYTNFETARRMAGSTGKALGGLEGKPPASAVRKYVEAYAKNKRAAELGAPIMVQQRFYDRYMKVRNEMSEKWPHVDLDTGMDDAARRWNEAHPMFGPGAGW